MADRPKDQPHPTGSPPSPPREIGARDVLTYLRDHPGFLDRHPDALMLLRPPTREVGEGVVDFQHFMLDRMRHDLARLQNEQRILIATSRSSIASQGRIHQAVLAILGASSFEQLLQIVTTDLSVQLDTDIVTIAVETPGGPTPRLPMAGIHLMPAGTVNQLLGAGRPALLAPKMPGDPVLFGAAAGVVRSQALLRLSFGPSAPTGLLCIGTRKLGSFHPRLGTELLVFLARALEITIAQWLDIER